ncbi:MAG TPA: phospholipase D-like domain-containing protein [Pyrinomonadaceae bacterium]|nr:phospholipase D-like domain-containing protein [Pyrinomonadaceae bacterium]
MQKVISNNIWGEIQRLASKSKTRRAAIAYVTTDKHLKFGKGDVLVVDASDVAIECGETSAAVLSQAYKRGAALFSSDRLHAKFILLDQVAVVGSANLSSFSANQLLEVAAVTDSPQIMSGLSAVLDQLMSQCKSIDQDFLEHISSIKVVRRPRANKLSRKINIDTQKNRTWLIGVRELDGSRYVHEEDDIAKGAAKAEKLKTVSKAQIGWIRYAGTTRFRSEAQKGDTVIQIWRSLRSKKPTRVYKRAAILLRQEEPKCTRFFIEEPRDADKEALSWVGFKKLLDGVGFPGRVGSASERLLRSDLAEAIFSLWNLSHNDGKD